MIHEHCKFFYFLWDEMNYTQFRIEYKMLLSTYKCVHGQAPQCLSFYTRTIHWGHLIQYLLKEKKARLKSYGDKSFLSGSTTSLEHTTYCMRNYKTVDSFKSSLKASLFKQDYLKHEKMVLLLYSQWIGVYDSYHVLLWYFISVYGYYMTLCNCCN